MKKLHLTTSCLLLFIGLTLAYASNAGYITLNTADSQPGFSADTIDNEDDCIKEIDRVIEATDHLIAEVDSEAVKEVAADSVMKKWGPVVNAIATLESRKNPGVVSRCGNYVGYLQISKVLVNECNTILSQKKYTYKDRLDKQKSYEMFVIIQNRHNPEGSVEKAVRLWKSGDAKCMQRKSRTETYYRKFLTIYSENDWMI